jgi:hypothetical protein
LGILLGSAVIVAGCGSDAAQQAQQARSSYISARAVLVGVQEFPGRIEEMLRSTPVSDIPARAQSLSASTRNLVTSSAAAFSTAKQNAQELKDAGGAKYAPYADELLQLVSLNEQALNYYSELIGLSNSLASSMPYSGDPANLMPSLDYLDDRVSLIQQLAGQVEQQEAQAETLYQSLINPA